MLQVAAAGRLEPEAGERGPLAGGGEVLDIETGHSQRARRSRRLHLVAQCEPECEPEWEPKRELKCEHSPRHHQRHHEREEGQEEEAQQEKPQAGCGRRSRRRQRQSLDMHRPLTNAVHRR